MALRSVKKRYARPQRGSGGMYPRKIWISGLVKSFLMQFSAKIARLGGLQNLGIVLASYNIIPRSQRLRRRGSASYRIDQDA